jgi:hypothetical protein
MSSHINSGEIQHEVRATLAARRDLGTDPAYDDHFVEALVQRLLQHQQQSPQALTTRKGDSRVARTPSPTQRMLFALLSLALLIPLAYAGWFVFALACPTVLVLNILLARAHER